MERVQNADFDLQFADRQVMAFPAERVSVVDIVPEHLADQTPVLLGVGWAEDQNTYKKTLKVLHDEKRRSVAVSYPGRGEAEESFEEYPEVELRHAQSVLAVLDQKGIERTDAIFHSEGAISGHIAATLQPGRFRNIVLDKPAGLIGEDGKARLVGRFVKLMAQEAIERKPFSFTDPTNGTSSIARVALYMLKHRELFTELEALTTQDITGLIHGLEEQGVMLSIIAGPSDPLFPVSRQIHHMRASQEATGKRLPIEGYYSVRGGHNELSIHADTHAALAADALKGLQRRRERLKRD